MTGKTLDVLRLLVEAEGRLVDRQTFNAQLWPEVMVEDCSLTVHISALRKALGGDCIETVAKNDYRMAVSVRIVTRQANGRAMSESALVQRALALDANDAAAHAGLAST